jgi:hypothetical protein
MRALKKILILSHRYIGIPLSFMFVLWFVSAFFMIYTGGMPRITPDMRVEAAPAINFSDINLSPQQASQSAGFAPSTARLFTLLGRPAYELQGDYTSTFVFADSGEMLSTPDQAEAAQIASEFLSIPVELFTYIDTINQADQWTLSSQGDFPLYKFHVEDNNGTQVYVSSTNANVSVYTTSQSRLLAWLGTIPHWLYFSSLRLNQPLWYDIVVWSSGIGCIMALLGLCLGVTQFRKVRPFKLKRAIPYSGLMRWHYILGVLFGVISLTWVFSGLLSMEPFAWNNVHGINVDREVYTEGELDLSAFPALNTPQWATLSSDQIKEVEFVRLHTEEYYIVSYSNASDLDMNKRERLHQPYNIIAQAQANSTLIHAESFKASTGFDPQMLIDKLDTSIPDATVLDYTLLENYDAYYYSRNDQLPLPVLRVKFNDPLQSWIYIDPQQSQLLTVIHKWSRLERWLYNGLHSLDFAFWYHQRPLWDIGVIFLLGGGLATSLLGLYFGLRRVKRDALTLFHTPKTS